MVEEHRVSNTVKTEMFIDSYSHIHSVWPSKAAGGGPQICSQEQIENRNRSSNRIACPVAYSFLAMESETVSLRVTVKRCHQVRQGPLS